jgi:HSP20 family protein
MRVASAGSQIVCKEVSLMANEKEQSIAVQRKKGGELLSWPEEMERFFERAMQPFGMWPWRPMIQRQFFPYYQRAKDWIPEVDILEKNGNIIIQADLPGMKREDIEVAVEGDALIIRGHRKEEKETKEEDYYCSERAVGEFYRSFNLPEGVNASAIQATYQNGVLEVKMPRPATPETKKTKVQVK